LNTRGWI